VQVFKTLWELTNEQIMVTREVYQEKFGQDLKEVLNKFTSGPFQLLTLMVVDRLRVEFGQLSVRIDGGYKLYKTQTPTPVRFHVLKACIQNPNECLVQSSVLEQLS
jgi:hypothetical protein